MNEKHPEYDNDVAEWASEERKRYVGLEHGPITRELLAEEGRVRKARMGPVGELERLILGLLRWLL